VGSRAIKIRMELPTFMSYKEKTKETTPCHVSKRFRISPILSHRSRSRSSVIYFIAHAILVCSAPISPDASPIHVAHKVANYCRMAQLCLSMGHSEEGSDFSKAEAACNKILKEQIAILEEFLSGQDA